MADPIITYSQLEDLLRSFGFEFKKLAAGPLFFYHPLSVARATLPDGPRDRVSHHIHWMGVRSTLDDFGFLPRDQFFDAVRERSPAA